MTTTITMETAQKIIAGTLAKGGELGLKPLTVAVLDAGGHLKALSRQDGASPLRPEVAQGKARGAVMMGMGSRALGDRAEQQAYFIQSVNALAGGSLVPVPGGVLVIGGNDEIIGAVGVTGDTSDNDETAAVAGIEGAGLKASTG